MNKITNLSNQSQKDILLKELDELLSQLSDVFGVKGTVKGFATGNGKAANVRILFEIEEKQNQPPKEAKEVSLSSYEIDWDSKCKKFGVDPIILHKEFNFSMHNTVIKGEILGIWSMRKQYNPVVVREIHTGRIFKSPVLGWMKKNA